MNRHATHCLQCCNPISFGWTGFQIFAQKRKKTYSEIALMWEKKSHTEEENEKLLYRSYSQKPCWQKESNRKGGHESDKDSETNKRQEGYIHLTPLYEGCWSVAHVVAVAGVVDRIFLITVGTFCLYKNTQYVVKKISKIKSKRLLPTLEKSSIFSK